MGASAKAPGYSTHEIKVLACNQRQGLGELQQPHELHLGNAVTLDIALRRLDRPVASEKLDVSKGATSPVHQPGRIGDEGAPSGM